MNTTLRLSDEDFAKEKTALLSFSINNKMVTFPEEQIVCGLKQRNQQMLSYLYDNYAAALNGVIHHTVKNKHCAEDLLQEAFIKIWNNIDSYDATKGTLFTWMKTLTVNHTIDFSRSRYSRIRKQTDSGDIADTQVSDPTYKQEKFDSIGIDKNIGRLKPEHIQLINMVYYNGLTQKEISKQLGMPLGTVKTKIRTAITELRKTVM